MGRSEDEKREQGGSAAKKTAKSTSKPANQEEKEAAEHQRKAQVESKIRERVASEARAFDVVNRLIEPNITSEFLLQACQFIDHSHYEDIVEERSISHLCGYPLCNNVLRQVAKKKYHISTKSNTVYDITERKKFCSNRCYHASEHLQKQIPQTPVWTRRGEDMECFDLLQHDVSSHLEGKEVIGSKMVGLKEEVALLEKLDKLEMKAARTQKAKSAADAHESLKESKHLSNHLLSLSTEEDLDRGMEKLSLSADKGDGEPSVRSELSGSSSKILGVSSKDVEREEKTQRGQTSVEKHDDKQKMLGEKVTAIQGDHLELETSMKDLTLQDRGHVNSIDSDDDSAENSEREHIEVSKNKVIDCVHETQGETQDSAVSKPCTALLGSVEADSDDDEEGVEDCHLSVSKMTESDNQPKPQNSGVTDRCAVERDSKAGDKDTVVTSHEQNEKPKENTLKQQPGESKSAYLMRLLDRRRNLLSQVADIQSDFSETVRKSESKTNCSACSSEIDGNTDKAKSVEPNRKESTDKEYKHCRDSSEKLKQGEENVSDPEASRPSRKKKNTQAHKKSSKTVTPVEASPLSSICQVISTWISTDTLDYLGLTSGHSEGNKQDRSNSTSTFLKDPEMQTKYQDLCQRLAGQERDFDNVLGEEEVEADGDKRGGKKPLPNFEELKKDTEEHSLKVQQFLAGSTTVKSKSAKAKADEEDGDKADTGRPIVFPDIDSQNQLLIRRRIVLERLDHTMPSLLPPLGLSVQDVSAYLRELVFTFSLTSHNIIFKPAEWTLAAIILLKMMENKCEAVNTAFQCPARSSAFNMVLSRLDHSSSSLGQLVQDMLTQRRLLLQGE